MTPVTQAARRGSKHRCAACGAAFYDLERELTACPKCETPYATSARMPRGEAARKRSSSKGARPVAPEAETAPPPEATDEDNKHLLDDADDAEEAEDSEEADEETSEPAEDDKA